MIKLRRLNYEYALEIDEIWKQFWSDSTLPDTSSKIIDAVVVDDEKVLAYGQVKLFAEMMYFPDLNVSRRARMEALKLIMEEAYRGCELAGLKEVYAMCRDRKFASLMAKHFGFYIVENPGVLIVKNLGE